MSFNEWEQARKEFKKEKQTFTWSITYLNEWRHFHRQFLLFFIFFLSVFLSSKSFRNNWMLCKIIDHYLNVFFDEIQPKKLKLELRVFWTSKPVYRPLKQPGYVTAMELSIGLFIWCLAFPRPNLGHSQGESLTNPMLIIVLYLCRPEGLREPCNEVGSLSLAEDLAGFEPGTFQF